MTPVISKNLQTEEFLFAERRADEDISTKQIVNASYMLDNLR